MCTQTKAPEIEEKVFKIYLKSVKR